MASFAGIQFKEHVPGSPEVQLGDDSSQCVRMLDCDWDDRFALALLLITQAAVTFDPIVNKKVLTRRVPHSYAFDATNVFLGTNILYATRILKIEGLGRPNSFVEGAGTGGDASIPFVPGQVGPVAVYDKARLHVLYQTLTYDVLSDADLSGFQGNSIHEYGLRRFVTKITRPNVENLTSPQGAFKRVYPSGSAVASADYPVQWGVNKVIGTETLQLTWHNIPQEAVSNVLHNPSSTTDYYQRGLGKVNNAAFAGYAAGTLLLLSYDIRPIMHPFRRRSYDITFHIKHFNPTGTIGHNHIWAHNPPTASPSAATTTWEWVEVTTTGATNLVAKTDGISIFDWYDYTQLFTPA